MTPVARWVAFCAAGELAGFGAAGVLAFALFGAIPDPTTALAAAALVLGCAAIGVVEGAVLGLFQWTALRGVLPALRAREWIGATAAAGAIGWTLGSLPPALVSLSGVAAGSGAAWDPDPAATIAVSATGGAILGAGFGALQWLALRRHARRSGHWIATNALGWALALPLSYLAGGSDFAAGSAAHAALAAIATGAAMGTIVALATSGSVRRLLLPDRPSLEHHVRAAGPQTSEAS
jgi:hypothetical protein